eukprot:16801-Heterococcus_DN1.PRE.2
MRTPLRTHCSDTKSSTTISQTAYASATRQQESIHITALLVRGTHTRAVGSCTTYSIQCMHYYNQLHSVHTTCVHDSMYAYLTLAASTSSHTNSPQLEAATYSCGGYFCVSNNQKQQQQQH